ncbi:hypothetical protein ACFWYW_46480 [Nonomuraea sp. NPDC059023]|uniref:hypothetical protein n=1 Tax=unclassified Nonomuraea TaxID=2593643 RepID=UPI0036A00AED
MLDQLLTNLDKRRLRLQAALVLVDRAPEAAERDNAQALAHRIRNRIHAIEKDLPTGSGHVVIPTRCGFGRIRLNLVVNLIKRLDGWPSLYCVENATFRNGDYTLTWTARADRVTRISTLLREFLDDVDQAALEAARTHRAFLRRQPEEHHAERDRRSLVRAYRRDFLLAYGAALTARLVYGLTSDAPGVLPGQSPALDAQHYIAAADLTRYELPGPRAPIALHTAS